MTWAVLWGRRMSLMPGAPGASKLGAGVIVARPRSPAGPGSDPSFFGVGCPFAGGGPQTSRTISIRHELLNTPGDHLLALFFIEGTMNAESLFASEEEAKRQTLVRL